MTDRDRKRQNRGWGLISSACRRFVVFEMEILCRRSFKCISTTFISTSLTTSHAQMPGKGIVALFPCALCSIIFVIAIFIVLVDVAVVVTIANPRYCSTRYRFYCRLLAVMSVLLLSSFIDIDRFSLLLFVTVKCINLFFPLKNHCNFIFQRRGYYVKQ